MALSRYSDNNCSAKFVFKKKKSKQGKNADVNVAFNA